MGLPRRFLQALRPDRFLCFRLADALALGGIAAIWTLDKLSSILTPPETMVLAVGS